MVKFEKPRAFYETFERKGAGEKTTHYCPGCGHGIAHKLIAQAIDDFGIQDRVIFCSPVGCSVFAYYYFDTGNIQCSHGRAPAVATGIRRTLRDAIVISYQGDGDLAGIGTAEIIHAANRGENISAFFINNAIYGMTGGQMAPTTLIGQKTLTTPRGRTSESEGNPIAMAELITTLAAPVFVERVSLADGPRVLRARKAIRKAIKNQIEGRGFSFVEILSPCPVNWKLTPVEARLWVKEHLEPVFPVRNFRDLEPASHPTTARPRAEAAALVELLRESTGITADDGRGQIEAVAAERATWAAAFNKSSSSGGNGRHDGGSRTESVQMVKIAGFGGQGVLSAGLLLANCGTIEGRHATWLPSYGPEMRGGTANASVVLADEVIGSPLVDRPNVLIAMNGPSLDAFETAVEPGGLIIVNSSIVDRRPTRTDIEFYPVPASDIARDKGLMQAANVVMVTISALLCGAPAITTIRRALPLSLKREKLVEANQLMVEAALEYFENHPEGGFPK